MTREDKLLRIRDLEGDKGTLERAHRLIEAVEGTINNPADSDLDDAMVCLNEAIGKYDAEIERLS